MARSNNEEGPDRQGPAVSDIERQHSSGRKPYAEGGRVDSIAKGLQNLTDEGLERYRKTNEETMNKQGVHPSMKKRAAMYHEAALKAQEMRKPKMAEGGHVQFNEAEDSDDYESEHRNSAVSRTIYSNEMMDQPTEEHEEEMHDSLAAAIMAKRRKMMSGSGSPDEDRAVHMADGGMVDIESNAKEHPNRYYHQNEDVVLKENYDEDMHDVTQPMDSNEHSDDIDEDVHDMISRIRAKMRAGR
jgi:hypothetical protein